MTAQLILAIAGGIVVLGGATAVIKSQVIPFITAISDFLSDWNGEPARPGVKARAGVMARLEANEVQMDAIRHEMHPNSGLSMRDAVDRVESGLAEHIRQSALLLEQERAAEADIRGLLEQRESVEQEIRGTITQLAEAVNVAARSTPPEEG